MPNNVTPNSSQLFSKASIWILERGSFIPSSLFEVGTPWSTVARVISGCLTFLPASLKLSNA